MSHAVERSAFIPADAVTLDADLVVPDGAAGVVLFAHGSGSSRLSPRNVQVARGLQAGGFATLLIDLLTAAEARIDDVTRHLRLDLPLLARRLAGPIAWLAEESETRGLPIGLFGASTGAGAALIAAARQPTAVRAVVSRGGRPDLAGDALPEVLAPTLLIVGGRDVRVIELNEQAQRAMTATTRLAIVPGAGHLFEEPGALETVIQLASGWYAEHLIRA